MSYTKDNYAFADYAERIDNEMLNRAYSKYGRTFPKYEEAHDFHLKNPGSYLYAISNYKSSDIEEIVKLNDAGKHVFHGGKPRLGAVRFITEYLVQTIHCRKAA